MLQLGQPFSMAGHSIKPIAHKTPVEDEIALHKKGWIAQRAGWILMLLFLLAALLGLFGEGPLSEKKVKSGNMEVEYQRFCRYEHHVVLKLLSAGENIIVVSLPQAYVEKFKIDKIVPTPYGEVASPGYVDYLFRGTKNDNVRFYMAPAKKGSAGGVIRVNNQPVSIQQYIYP